MISSAGFALRDRDAVNSPAGTIPTVPHPDWFTITPPATVTNVGNLNAFRRSVLIGKTHTSE